MNRLWGRVKAVVHGFPDHQEKKVRETDAKVDKALNELENFWKEMSNKNAKPITHK